MATLLRGTLMRAALAAMVIGLFPLVAAAHCDTMDGPVVADARAALEKGDPTGVLQWVDKAHEGEIRDAFRRTLAVRGKGAEARELADMYFFETLVRIHRAGEGAPYTGLKPSGTDPGPAVTAADKALEQGSPDAVARLIAERINEGIRKRFAAARDARQHRAESVEAGRKFVAAYVEFTHFVERLYDAGAASAAHGEGDHAAPAHAPPGHSAPPADAHGHGAASEGPAHPGH